MEPLRGTISLRDSYPGCARWRSRPWALGPKPLRGKIGSTTNVHPKVTGHHPLDWRRWLGVILPPVSVLESVLRADDLRPRLFRYGRVYPSRRLHPFVGCADGRLVAVFIGPGFMADLGHDRHR